MQAVLESYQAVGSSVTPTLDEVLDAERWARAAAEEHIAAAKVQVRA